MFALKCCCMLYKERENHDVMDHKPTSCLTSWFLWQHFQHVSLATPMRLSHVVGMRFDVTRFQNALLICVVTVLSSLSGSLFFPPSMQLPSGFSHLSFELVMQRGTSNKFGSHRCISFQGHAPVAGHACRLSSAHRDRDKVADRQTMKLLSQLPAPSLHYKEQDSLS